MWEQVVDSRRTKRIVAQGYEQIADKYLERFGASTVRALKLNELVAHLPVGAAVLDLGCGAGVPVARELARRGCAVTGVDGSARQIKRARTYVPQASFIHADMTAVAFPPETFDAVCAFYSMTHVPREEHAALLNRIAVWLKPEGRFLASFGTTEGDWSGEWLGVPMFFSHHDPRVTCQLIANAGLLMVQTEVLEQDNEDAAFLWISSQKIPFTHS